MKKLIIIISTILLIVIIGLIIEHTFFRHTPQNVLKRSFNISLKDFDYNVETFDELWYNNPSGDGHTLAVYKFNSLTQENIEYLKGFDPKPLPVTEKDHKLMSFNKIPKEFLNSDTGYYIYKPLSNHDSRDYKVFIIDTKKKRAVFYCQYM